MWWEYLASNRDVVYHKLQDSKHGYIWAKSSITAYKLLKKTYKDAIIVRSIKWN